MAKTYCAGAALDRSQLSKSYVRSSKPIVCRDGLALRLAAVDHPAHQEQLIACGDPGRRLEKLIDARLANSFAEYMPELNRETKKDVVWFVFGDESALATFAGIWTEFNGSRGTQSKPIPRSSLNLLLATAANAIVAPATSLVLALRPRNLRFSQSADAQLSSN